MLTIMVVQHLGCDKKDCHKQNDSDKYEERFHIGAMVMLQLIALRTLLVSVVYLTEILIVVDAGNVLLPPPDDE